MTKSSSVRTSTPSLRGGEGVGVEGVKNDELTPPLHPSLFFSKKKDVHSEWLTAVYKQHRCWGCSVNHKHLPYKVGVKKQLLKYKSTFFGGIVRYTYKIVPCF